MPIILTSEEEGTLRMLLDAAQPVSGPLRELYHRLTREHALGSGIRYTRTFGSSEARLLEAELRDYPMTHFTGMICPGCDATVNIPTHKRWVCPECGDEKDPDTMAAPYDRPTFGPPLDEIMKARMRSKIQLT